MNQVDKISKEALSLLTYSKDVAATNLTTANARGGLEPKLTDEQVTSVLNLFEHSLSQGFQKGLESFQRIVKQTITQDIASNNLDTKKKK